MKRKLTIEIEEYEQPEDEDTIRYSTKVKVLVDGQQLGILSRLSLVAKASEHIPRIEVGVLEGVPLSDCLPEVKASARKTVEALKPFKCVNTKWR